MCSESAQQTDLLSLRESGFGEKSMNSGFSNAAGVSQSALDHYALPEITWKMSEVLTQLSTEIDMYVSRYTIAKTVPTFKRTRKST